MSAKVSLPLPNVANRIACHVASKFPTLAREPIPGVWFTGSNVWSFVVGIDPRPDADWDIFALGEVSVAVVVRRLDLVRFPACRTAEKRLDGEPRVDPNNIARWLNANGEPHRAGPKYGDGFCYFTDGGEIDVWLSMADSVCDELQTYPEESHAHCRAAFSFTEGLVMLPNSLIGVFP